MYEIKLYFQIKKKKNIIYLLQNENMTRFKLVSASHHIITS